LYWKPGSSLVIQGNENYNRGIKRKKQAVEKGNEWKVYINGGFPANNGVRDTGLLSALVGISSAVIYVDDGNIEGVCKSNFKFLL